MGKTRGGGSSAISRYMSDIWALPLLTKEQEQAIAVRLREENSSGAHADLVTSNLGFVVKIVSEYKNRGLPFEDLLNEGNIGLIEAARHFDPSRGTRFITYAVWWIRKCVLRTLAQHSALVRIPIYQLTKIRSVQDTRRKLSRELGRNPDREEISKELGVAISKIDAILLTKMRELSLDDKVGEDKDTPLSEYLVDACSANPEQILIKQEDRTLVCHLLPSLGVEDQTVLINHYGLGGGRVFSLTEIGRRLGVSRERVRQMKERAHERLRRLIKRRQSRNSWAAADRAPGRGRALTFPHGPRRTALRATFVATTAVPHNRHRPARHGAAVANLSLSPAS